MEETFIVIKNEFILCYISEQYIRMFITNNLEEIKYYCDVLKLISEIDDIVFFGEIVQDLICQMNYLSPPCVDFFSGVLSLRDFSKQKILLPVISCIGDASLLTRNKVANSLNSTIINTIKTDMMTCLKIWNGNYAIDVVFSENLEIHHEMDNLVWSMKTGFEFFYEPQIEKTSIFEPFTVQVFRSINKAMKKCFERKTILHELDTDICWNLIRRGWSIDNIFKPATNLEQANTCMVCLCPFSVEEKASVIYGEIVTSCGKHNFHQFCLLSWWDHAHTIYGCSVCKNEILTQSYQICDDDSMEVEVDIDVDLP
jgi:hypothetical protein